MRVAASPSSSHSLALTERKVVKECRFVLLLAESQRAIFRNAGMSSFSYCFAMR